LIEHLVVYWTGAGWNSGIDGSHVSLCDEETEWEKEFEEEVLTDAGTVPD
jgi:hypothetical protein